ncbi:hypothetical protein [Mycoplana rhizolycopersici]|uniref:Uncharacterized protein n=1 Tax=Mycoplana rhizolycopersici TaxID=2746702 RepID=A0ABX2QKY1_9HYPH|nr:hypothetical protein [Rhizobium rhizolycopersici]NVP58031.1 hypothetical protein [Rhizobium rhizolycopersici]
MNLGVVLIAGLIAAICAIPLVPHKSSPASLSSAQMQAPLSWRHIFISFPKDEWRE